MKRSHLVALLAAIVVTLIGGVAAAVTHSSDSKSVTTAAPVEVTTTTTTPVTVPAAVPETTTTAPAPPPTTAAPRTTTTQRAAPVTAPVAAPTTTTAPRPGFNVSPSSVAAGQDYAVGGGGCAGAGYGVAVKVYFPDGALADSNGGAAQPDGTWTLPMRAAGNSPFPPGKYRISADCMAGKTVVFPYADQYLTVTG